MQKKSNLIIILFIGALILSSCSLRTKQTQKNLVKQENRLLKIAVFEGGYESTYWEEVKKAFEQDYPDVSIEITANPKIGEIIKPQILSGNVPDFIYLPRGDNSGVTEKLIKDRELVELTSLFEEKVFGEEIILKEKVIQDIIENPRIRPYGDDGIYLAPLYYDISGLFYNKKILRENGWSEPSTWQEFFELGEKAKQKGIALFTYQGLTPSYNEIIILSALATLGGEIFIEDIFNYRDGIWEEDIVEQVLNIYKQIGEKGYLLNGSTWFNYTKAQSEFFYGNALFIPCGNWLENEMKEVIPDDFELGFIPIPAFEENQTRYVQVNVQQMYIPEQGKNTDLAKEFLKYQYTDKAIKLNAQYGKGVVCVNGAVEQAKPYLSSVSYEAFNIFDKDIKPIWGTWKMNESNKENIEDILFENIGQVLVGEKEIGEWVSELEALSDELRKLILVPY